MNELDWWIASQWEMFKIKEGKTGLEFNKTDKEGNVLAVDRTQKWNKLRAKTDLKEMYIVRYADDFKLFCRDYVTAKKVMYATKLWLAENLHLQTSEEKSGITNLRKNYTTFLGIKFKVVPKGNKWIIRSHMADKSKEKVIKKLRDVWKNIKNPSKQSEIDRNISLYNAMVMGMHNYYSMATLVSADFAEIAYKVTGKNNGMNHNNRCYPIECQGEVIHIAAGSDDHINAMDMVENYGEGKNPVIDKSEFILSLFEQLDKKGIGPKEKSIIDRCVFLVYEDYQTGGKLPTLVVLREKLLEQPEKEAKNLALELELFTNGSLNAFAHKTNVDTNNRMIVYDIMDLGKQLKTMGLLVITDAMLNRVTENWRKGIRTHVFIDEFHVVFENEYSASFFNSAWRQFRKRNAYPTGITQNVEYLLDSVMASTMLSNSEFVVMLNQASQDRGKLAKMLNISDEQMSYITNADAGCGLLKYGSSLVPFINRFPTDTRLYRLMTTKPTDRKTK